MGELGRKQIRQCWLGGNYGSYVGNTMAAFVMQSLGFEVAALNTVQFSKSPAYPTSIIIAHQDSR